MEYRESLAKAIINKLLSETSMSVYLTEADDDASDPYLVYNQITDGDKNYAFYEDEAVTSRPLIQIDLWDGSPPASGTTEQKLDKVDDILDQTKIDDEGLAFTLFNAGGTEREYQDDSGLWMSWLRYRAQVT